MKRGEKGPSAPAVWLDDCQHTADSFERFKTGLLQATTLTRQKFSAILRAKTSTESRWHIWSCKWQERDSVACPFGRENRTGDKLAILLSLLTLQLTLATLKFYVVQLLSAISTEIKKDGI